MFQTNLGTSQDVLEWKLIPRVRDRSIGSRSVDKKPKIVVIEVRVQCDLLFCLSASSERRRSTKLTLRSTGICRSVRVKIPSLGVDVSDGNLGPKSDIFT